MIELNIGGIYRLYYIITCQLFSKLSVIYGIEGEDHKNSSFLKNRGRFKAKVNEKGSILSTWRTLMGSTNFPRVEVPGANHTCVIAPSNKRGRRFVFNF